MDLDLLHQERVVSVTGEEGLVDGAELEEYQEFVASCPQPTEKSIKDSPYLKGWWAASQMTCEAAEVLTIYEKAVRKGKTIDLGHLTEELGDVMWGLACICETEGISFDDVCLENIIKLKARHEITK
jgi:NTP pyrophosphatase (non-canonical NTP hydrolase)